MKAWHFHNGLLRNGEPVPPIGEPLYHEGPLEICESGLHASTRLIDALLYAPGNYLCRVDMAECKHYPDKLVARRRTILWQIDATDLLHKFAVSCACKVLRRVRIRDKRLWALLRIKLAWIRGNASDKELQDARINASYYKDIMWEYLITYAATQSSAYTAAREVAYNARVHAALDVPDGHATLKVSIAERTRQNLQLTRLVIAERMRTKGAVWNP